MYDTFFERQFSYLRSSKTIEEREEIIKFMVEEFTLYTLSKIDYEDYVVPNYTRKILHNFDYEIIDIPDKEYDHIKIIFPDFTVIFDDNKPLKIMERNLKNRIMKYAKINADVLYDSEIDDLDKELKNIFSRSNPHKVIDVIVVNHDEPYEHYTGGDVYIRDVQCPYLIHKFLSYDDDVYKAIRESNRSITEFMTKFENEYNSSFFL